MGGAPPAVDDDGGGDLLGVVSDGREEVESWLRGGGHSVIWPRREPEVGDVTRHKFLEKESGEKENVFAGTCVIVSVESIQVDMLHIRM